MLTPEQRKADAELWANATPELMEWDMRFIARARTAVPEYEAHIQELERRLANLSGIRARAEALEQIAEETAEYTNNHWLAPDWYPDGLETEIERVMRYQAQTRAENARENQYQEEH